MARAYSAGGVTKQPHRPVIAPIKLPTILQIGIDTQLVSTKAASDALLAKYGHRRAASGLEQHCRTDWAEYEGYIFRRFGKGKFMIHLESLYAAIADPGFKL